MATNKQWGLRNVRNPDGSRKVQEHNYEFQGEEINIKLIPPTAEQLDEYEGKEEDMSATELAEIVDRHIVKPEIENPGEYTMVELNAYVQGILDFSAGDEELNQALAERGGEMGNSPP